MRSDGETLARGSVPEAPPMQALYLYIGYITEAQVHMSRHMVRKALDDWALCDLADGAELVITELLTNVLKHVAGTDHGPSCQIRLDVTAPQTVCLRVGDRSPVVPHIPSDQPDPFGESGRGLWLIHSLAQSFQYEVQDGRGKQAVVELQAAA